MAKGNSQKKSNGSDLDFEAQLWTAAYKMRGHIVKCSHRRMKLRGIQKVRGQMWPRATPTTWKLPRVNNAKYAWIQHFIHHRSPVGVAGSVLANGSMSTQTTDEGEIYKVLIEAGLANAITNN